MTHDEINEEMAQDDEAYPSWFPKQSKDALKAYGEIDWQKLSDEREANLKRQWSEQARAAFKAGFKACSAGSPRDGGPPESGELAGEMWDCGWLLRSARMDAQAERKRAEDFQRMVRTAQDAACQALGTRPAVRWFAEQMERRLCENEHRAELARPNGAFCVNRCVMNVYQAAAAPKPKEVDHAADAANWLLLMLGKDVNEVDVSGCPGS